MTAQPFPPPITCPSSLIASCPPLVGFIPEDSLVAFVHGVPGRTAPVVVRSDLPPPHRTASAAQQLAASIAGTGGAAADLVAWTSDEPGCHRDCLTSRPLLDALDRSLAEAGIERGSVLTTNGRVWWSSACADPRCCPASSTPLDPRVVDAVRAEYVFAGYAPLASRDQVAQRVARDDLAAAEVRRVLARRRPAATSRWRDSQIDFLTRLLLAEDACRSTTAPLSAANRARALRALADRQVRDVMLLRLVVGDDRGCAGCWSTTTSVLCELLRSAPSGVTAPVATVTALVAWLRGEGALATICLRRAEEQPDYRLAELARELMVRGTDPGQWQDSLRGLTEAECRAPARRPTGRGDAER